MTPSVWVISVFFKPIKGFCHDMGLVICFCWWFFTSAVLSDEQMSNGWPFSLLNDEQMSNKVGVEHPPVLRIGSPWDSSPWNPHIWEKIFFGTFSKHPTCASPRWRNTLEQRNLLVLICFWVVSQGFHSQRDSYKTDASPLFEKWSYEAHHCPLINP